MRLLNSVNQANQTRGTMRNHTLNGVLLSRQTQPRVAILKRESQNSGLAQRVAAGDGTHTGAQLKNKRSQDNINLLTSTANYD